MDIEHIPEEFRLQLVLLAGANLLLSALFEIFVVDYLVFHKFSNTRLHRRLNSNRPSLKYEQLRSQTADLNWLRQANVPVARASSNAAVTITTSLQANGNGKTADSYNASDPTDSLRSRNNGCRESLAEDSVLSGHSSTAMLISEVGSQQSNNHGRC